MGWVKEYVQTYYFLMLNHSRTYFLLSFVTLDLQVLGTKDLKLEWNPFETGLEILPILYGKTGILLKSLILLYFCIRLTFGDFSMIISTVVDIIELKYLYFQYNTLQYLVILNKTKELVYPTDTRQSISSLVHYVNHTEKIVTITCRLNLVYLYPKRIFLVYIKIQSNEPPIV